jgi:phage-related minor tail protein
VWMSIQASVIDAVISDPIANALKPILQSLFSQLAGAAGGAKPNARGDVFDRKSFFSAPGGLNSMSEYNPEAVMPLARTAT